MKPKSFLKGLSLLMILNFAIKPVWIFFIDRQMQNIAGAEAYGRYFAVLNLSIVLSFLADAGMTNMMNQRIADGSPVHYAHYFRIKMLLVGAFVTACLLAGWAFHLTHWAVLIYVVAIQAANSIFVFLRAIITGHQFYKADAWFSVIDKSMMILLCGVLIYLPLLTGTITLLLFLQIQLFCTVTALATALYFVYRRRLIAPGIAEKTFQVLRYVVPFTAIYLLMSVHYRLDGFLLERLHSAFEAGIYASAYRLLDAANMVGYLAASFIVPFIARHAGNRTAITSTLLTIRHALLLLATFAVSFTTVFAPFVQRLLYHTSDAYNADIIRLCLFSLPGYFLVHIYGSLFTAVRKFRPFIMILTGAVIVNAGLNLAFISTFGALACCVAAIVSQLATGIACSIASARLLGIPLHLKSFAIYILLGILLTCAFHFSQLAVHQPVAILCITLLLMVLLLASQYRRIQNYLLSLQ